MSIAGPMQISVHSEVGRLEAVLVHQPGLEIVRMTQHDLDRMLFDDILSPSEAAREHQMMAEVMAAAGATVFQLADLLTQALKAAPTPAVETLLATCCEIAGCPSLAPRLAEWPADRLAQAMLTGVYWRELDEQPTSLARVAAELRSDDPMALRPLPNIMFLRDPCISVFDAILEGRMATPARAREPRLVAFALEHAPQVGSRISFSTASKVHEAFHCIEGGDVLVLSAEVMMLGCSERTVPATIERLAHEVLFPNHTNLQRIYAVIMPTARSVMHLDTILTQVDRQVFLGHAPLIAASPRRTGLPVVRLERNRPASDLQASPLEVLRSEFGPETTLISCGGDDPLHQEREQWTDGANSIALGPSAIMLYARNRKTVGALERHGLRELHLSLDEPAELRRQRVQEVTRKSGRPTVLTFTGSELSRARGGGRCLTMPLRRKTI